MKFWTASKSARALGKSAAAGLMLLLWVGASALVASPQLHHFLHKDSGAPGHHCLVTHLTEQAVFAQAAVVAPAIVAGVLLCVASPAVEIFPSSDLRLSQSRAPPRHFALLLA